jgi:restriction system protein
MSAGGAWAGSDADTTSMHATTKIRQDFIGHLIRITKDAEVYGIVIVVAKTKPILGTMALSKSTTDGTMKVAAKQARKPEGARFVRYFGPLLDALRALGGSGTPDEVVERIAQDLRLSDDVQNELLPSGEPRYRNQVAWARFYLVREGLLDSSKRGVWSLTERGRATTLTPEQSREIFLRWVRIFQDQRRAESARPDAAPEQVAEGAETTTGDHRSAAIKLLLGLPPERFERLAQRLLREAGFTQVVVTGSGGDGGIDGYGTLQVNPLVSFKVLFQCKCYARSVSPSQVRDFRGAMAGRADKALIIMTGAFTAEARREASRDGVPPIELIDGDKLVDMLEQLELGLKPVRAFEIDESFFREFRS